MLPNAPSFSKKYASNQYNERPSNSQIKGIVIHYTDTDSLEKSLTYLCSKDHEVSSHYLLDEDGTIYELVSPNFRAWHAGVSHWRGIDNINDISVGIELQNDGKKPFSIKQIDSLCILCAWLIKKYHIAPYWILGHSDIAPDRKKDPGAFFPWQELASFGIGFWPSTKATNLEKFANYNDNDLLEFIGYNKNSINNISAFQRRFRTSAINNIMDDETRKLCENYASFIDMASTTAANASKIDE